MSGNNFLATKSMKGVVLPYLGDPDHNYNFQTDRRPTRYYSGWVRSGWTDEGYSDNRATSVQLGWG